MSVAPYSIGSDVWPGMSKVIEECGELQQVLGKIIALGGETEHWDGTDLRDRVRDELADLAAAIEFFIEMNEDDKGFDLIAERAERKLELFQQWQAEQEDEDGL